VSIPLRDIAGLLHEYWKPFNKGEDMETAAYNFGQIFRLHYSHAEENDYYILAAIGDDMFCLVNLQWGSRMSDPMMYPKSRGGIPWTLISQHASYFIEKMDAELIPVTDVRMTFNDLPKPSAVFSGEGPIGVQR
jgi:hypothetical protein